MGKIKKYIFKRNGLDLPIKVENAVYVGESPALALSGYKNIFISPDGINCFISVVSTRQIHMYTMSTPYDITTLIYVGVSPVLTYSLEGWGMSNDGSKLFAGRYDNGRVYEYNMSPNWDVVNATFGIFATTNQINDRVVSPCVSLDGTKMYILYNSLDYIGQFSMSVPFDISTLSYINQSPFVVGGVSTDLKISDDGRFMIVGHDLTNYVRQFELTTPFDITTLVEYSNLAKEPFVGSRGSHLLFSKRKLYLLNHFDNVIEEFNV